MSRFPDETISREFRGYAGGGPLTVSLYHDDAGRPEGVHIGWDDGGMYLTPFGARRLASYLIAVSQEAQERNAQ